MSLQISLVLWETSLINVLQDNLWMSTRRPDLFFLPSVSTLPESKPSRKLRFCEPTSLQRFFWRFLGTCRTVKCLSEDDYRQTGLKTLAYVTLSLRSYCTNLYLLPFSLIPAVAHGPWSSFRGAIAALL